MKLIEALIAIFSIIGTFVVSYSLKPEHQIIGMVSWILANMFGIYFYVKKRLWYLMIQMIIFLVFSFMGIIKRII
jgi:hypothetical protein